MARRRSSQALDALAGARDGRTTRRQPLDLERIVRAALAVLDTEGLDGLSMRRLADALGVKAASLYWYVRDKDELLTLLADAISAEVRAPAPELPWRARLEALLADNRRVLLAHRDAARVMVGTPPVGANRMRLIDDAFAALLAAGLEGADVIRAARLLNDYVTSFVLEEVNEVLQAANRVGTADLAGIEQVEAATQRSFAALPAESFPAIAAVAAHVADPDLDARFRFGLKVILDGLERHLAHAG